MLALGSTFDGQVFAYLCFFQTGRSCVGLWHPPHCSLVTVQFSFASNPQVIKYVIIANLVRHWAGFQNTMSAGNAWLHA
jgi:hypothetical protein